MNKREKVRPWLKTVARVGFVADGLVYAVIGLLAFQAAFLSGGDVASRREAIRTIGQQPFGQIVLVVLIVGLVALAVWRFAAAYKGLTDSGPTDDVGPRVGQGVRGVVALAVAYITYTVLVGSGSGGNKEAWTQTLLRQPYGRWLVGMVAVIILGIAFYQFYQAYAVKFQRRFDEGKMDREAIERVTWLGRIGIVARAVLLAIIGVLFIQAAVQASSDEVGGIAEALATLSAQPFGPWLLGAVALGLIAFGLFKLMEARYHDFDMS